MCRSRQYDFNLVRHPTPEKQIFSFLFRKKRPQVGFEPRTPTPNPEQSHALARLAMALKLSKVMTADLFFLLGQIWIDFL